MKINENLTLDEAKRHFEDWRKERKSLREPIPEKLWEIAVSLTGQHSLTDIVKALHLGHNNLKERAEKHYELIRSDNPPQATFVEVTVPIRESLTPVRPVGCSRVELEKRDGTRMHLIANSEQGFDPSLLIQAFLGESHASDYSTK
jgi:hypothetical protein